MEATEKGILVPYGEYELGNINIGTEHKLKICYSVNNCCLYYYLKFDGKECFSADDGHFFYTVQLIINKYTLRKDDKSFIEWFKDNYYYDYIND